MMEKSMHEFEKMPEEYGRIVSMIRFGETTLVATERRIFRLVDDKFEAMRFRIVDEIEDENGHERANPQPAL